MGKDPAFLFYYQDFLVGTDHMTDEQVGIYIRCLCYQCSRGSIRASHMATLMGSQENKKVILEKFKMDENGEYFNQRLRDEIVKRREYTASRLKNLKPKNPHMGVHMENENEDENKKKDRIVKERKKQQKAPFHPPPKEFLDLKNKIGGTHGT